MGCFNREEACDPGCPGWGVFLSDTRGYEIERCDACGRFDDDDDEADRHSRHCHECAPKARQDWINATGQERETGTEELRRAAQLFAGCEETPLEAFSATELLRIARAARLCDWDIPPDAWGLTQLQRAAWRGEVPCFDDDGNEAEEEVSEYAGPVEWVVDVESAGVMGRDGFVPPEWVTYAQAWLDEHAAELRITVRARAETGCGGGLQLSSYDPRFVDCEHATNKAFAHAWEHYEK